MSRFFKILVPIVLTVAVLLSIGWYLMKYDPQFTRDLLVSHARKQSDKGNHGYSTWLYELAYKHSGNDETVALELSQQFKDVGNYTKAEYTLSHAIADGGSVDLYIALCKTYVEQDKLLDAVKMLENIADPNIKAQIDAMRPASPIPSQEPGFYDQYISVTFTSEDGAAYVTTDGEYPSTAEDYCADPITLPAGQTTFFALTVDRSGLVSPLSVMSYTVAGVIEEVHFTDDAIDQTVRDLLRVDGSHVFRSDELWGITSLSLPANVAGLEDLKWFPFLSSLTIHESTMEDLSGLSILSGLQDLVITDTPVRGEDLTVIANLPRLSSLTLRSCSLSGIHALSNAVGLQYLDLSGNAIRDLSAIAVLPELRYLDLSHNAVDDLNYFSYVTSLETLYVGHNAITDITPLSGCIALTDLDLTNNALTDITPAGNIPGLKRLSVAFNQLTDVSALSANTMLEELDISNNAITDITGLGTLARLVTFNFSYNQISQLPHFPSDCALVTIKGSQNRLISLNPLIGLNNLNYVFMDYNPELSSIACLATCERLVEVTVYGTAVTDVSAVTKTADGQDTGVTVKYSPI